MNTDALSALISQLDVRRKLPYK